MGEKIDELYKQYLNEKLDAIFNLEEKELELIKDKNDNSIEDKKNKNDDTNYTVSLDRSYRIIVKKDGKWNFINSKGEIISPNLWFDDVCGFANGYAGVQKDGKWNFINLKGEIISPNLWFDGVCDFANGYAGVQKDGKWNFINSKGEIISPNLWFDGVCDFANGYTAVKKDGKWNFINSKGEIISPNLWFDYFWPFANGYARVKKNGKWNFINPKGEIISPNLWFDDVCDFANGYAIVQKDGKWNFINSKVEIISPNLWFDDVCGFANGYAAVKKDGKWNFINPKGEIISPNLWFDDVDIISDFTNGYTKVIKYDKKHEYTYYMNTKGELFDAIISRNFAYVGKHIKCLTIDMQDYQVKKTILGYQCVNFNDKYNLKYEPIKRFGVRYTLCLKKNIVCLYDRISNNYKDIGTINDIEFDDNFIFDKRNEKVYLIYEDKMIDVTEYYNSYLSDKKGIHITSGIGNILTRDEFAFLNAREIENAMQEEKIRKKKEQEEIERLQKLQEIQEQKKRLRDEKEDHIRKQKALKDKAEQEKIDALKKIQEGLDTLRNNCVKELPTIREKVENIFVINDNYKEIDSDYLGVLMLIDLSQTDFSNVNVRNIDFRNTNIVISSFHLNPQTVYNKDLRNCNFEGIHIDPMANFSNVDIRGAKFSDDDNIATLDMFNYTFKDAIYDENTTYNGRSFSEIFEEIKKKGK